MSRHRPYSDAGDSGRNHHFRIIKDRSMSSAPPATNAGVKRDSGLSSTSAALDVCCSIERASGRSHDTSLTHRGSSNDDHPASARPNIRLAKWTFHESVAVFAAILTCAIPRLPGLRCLPSGICPSLFVFFKTCPEPLNERTTRCRSHCLPANYSESTIPLSGEQTCQ